MIRHQTIPQQLFLITVQLMIIKKQRPFLNADFNNPELFQEHKNFIALFHSKQANCIPKCSLTQALKKSKSYLI